MKFANHLHTAVITGFIPYLLYYSLFSVENCIGV